MADPRPFWRAWATVAGLAPWAAGIALYRFTAVATSQVAPVRVMALLVLHALVMAAVAAVVALAWVLLDGQRRLGRCLPAAAALAYAGALANLALIGLAVFYITPRVAPAWALAAAALGVATLLVAYRGYGAAGRAAVLQVLRTSGLAALAVPLLALPWILYAAATDQPRLVVAPPPASGAVRPDAPRRILIVSFDALRARSTQPYEPTAKTPALAALAAEASAFRGMRASADRTLMSCMTLLTGLRPSDVVHDPRHRPQSSDFLREGAVFGLPAHLKAAGYRSYYATMMLHPSTLSLAGQFDGGESLNTFFYQPTLNRQAFLPWREALDWWTHGGWAATTMAELPHDEVRATRQIFDRARAQIRAAQGPSFFWIHVGAPHLPYVDVDPRDLGKELHPERYRVVGDFEAIEADAARAREFEQVYEHYVRFADAEFGRFVAGLKADGTWDDSLIVVTGDHGESFEPGHMTHGNGRPTADVMNVPLLIRTPHQRTPHVRWVPTNHKDIVPTILARVYQAPIMGFKGVDLLSLPRGTDRVIYSWAPPPPPYNPQAWVPHSVAAHNRRFTFEARFYENRFVLYDMKASPDAPVEVTGRYPSVVARFKARLAEELAIPVR